MRIKIRIRRIPWIGPVRRIHQIHWVRQVRRIRWIHVLKIAEINKQI